MKKIASAETRRSFLLGFIVLGLIAAIIYLPSQFRSQAGSTVKDRNSDSGKTVSHQKGLEDYDIRTDKSQSDTIINFRQALGRNAVSIADARDRFVVGEQALRRSVPTLKIEYNEDIRTPEVIATDVMQGRAFLTAPSREKHSDILRRFVENNSELIGVDRNQTSNLKVTADYTNPDGNLSYARLEQTINDIPVFRGEVNAGFTRNGEMFRVINNLAPALEYSSLSTDFRNPLDAVKSAASNIKYELKDAALARNNADSTDLKTVFGQGDWATTAEKMYFPTEPGVARAAWRVLIWEPVSAFYVIVDAETGTILWRKNLTNDQTQAATYNVYTNSSAFMDVAENPQPITPGPLDPGLGTQGTQIPRTDKTLIGNEGVLSFNNLGWMTDGANGVNGWTDGNAVQAGLDIDGVNGVDASLSGTNRVFSFAYNPPPGINGTTPDLLTTVNSRSGAITQLFYTNNRYHDALYQLGFTEPARNFQNDNFGRGGLAADRVSAEAQDSSGTNNANFGAGADGTRGRMQMYRFTQTPGRDGDLDGDVVVHEHTHGLSNRLIGNNSGLNTTRSGGMGEGWSDFYGLALLSQQSDPINAIYTTGSYVTFGLAGTTNSYYGIRRFPYAVRSFTGGPNNRPHNPLTFADTNSGCDLSDGAYAASLTFAGGCNEVHAQGEVWAVALWEVRAKFVTRLGWTVGNKKVLQIVTDGMKLSPLNPNMVQERDSILSAAQASAFAPDATVDVADVWAGFAARGFGFAATDNGTTVVESFDLPNAVIPTLGFSVSDAAPGGDGDGFPEPGETVRLTVPVTNNTGTPVTNVTVTVTGGGTASYGTVANNATVTQTIPYTIPANTPCGSLVTVTLTLNSDLGSQSPVTRSFTVGAPVGGLSENFDGVTAPALPTGWTSAQISGTNNWVTTTTTPSSAPNAAFATDLAVVSLTSLTSPAVSIQSAAAKISFKNQFNSEATFDGMVLEYSTDGTTWTDVITGGGTFVSGGYTSTLSTGFSNPLPGRMAWSGSSAGYIDTVVNLPASLNGQSVRFRWLMGSDSSVAPTGGGAWVDSVQVVNGYNCSFVGGTVKSRADFDGDGKTDLSVFRPSDGNWYLQRSQLGFTALGWGASGDKLTPGDFDGDGKADTAVARTTGGVMTFYILNSQNSTASTVQFGAANDVPQIGDYDGDGKSDVAVFRPSNGVWYIRSNSGAFSSVSFGQSGDVPVANDYDGDGKADVAVFRSGVWYIQRSQLGFTGVSFGLSTDKLVPADYDGDGKTDIAVYRASEGNWYLLRSQLGFTGITFGISTDVPVPGDYDGDGKSDIGVFRNGTWYISRTAGGLQTATFGAATDLPIPKQYIP